MDEREIEELKTELKNQVAYSCDIDEIMTAQRCLDAIDALKKENGRLRAMMALENTPVENLHLTIHANPARKGAD